MPGSVSSSVTKHSGGSVQLPPQSPKAGDLQRNKSDDTVKAGRPRSGSTPNDPTQTVFADVTKKAAARTTLSAPSSIAAGSPPSASDTDPAPAAPASVESTSPQSVIGRDYPSRIAFPALAPDAPLPALLQTEFDAPTPAAPAAASSGHSIESLTLASGGPDDLRRDGSSGSDASIFGSSAAEVVPFDIESGEFPPLDKRRLGASEFSAKAIRANLIDSVKTYAIVQPMVNLDPQTNTAVRENMAALLGEIDATLAAATTETDSNGKTKYIDVESQRDITHLHEFKEKVEAKFDKLSGALNTLGEAKTSFLEYKARQATGGATFKDSVQRNIFGSEMHAVFARSALQSLIVVGATAGFQVGTAAILQSFFTNNPDKIPEPILTEAREKLGESASETEVIDEAVGSFVAPGSTYLDENTSSETAIYAAEAGVGGFRGVVVPMADSVNETDARAAKVQGAIDEAKDPKPEQSRKERAYAAMGNAWKAQVKANLVSGGIAAMISTATSGPTTGSKVLIEVAKTLGFSVVSALNNVAADGVRKAAYDGDSEAVSQTIKAGARVTGRGLAQVIKTGVSYAQSAASGEIDRRAPEGDAIKAVVQSLLSGGLKEALGSGFQNKTASSLPPNEVVALTAGKTVGSIAELARELNGLSHPSDLSREGLEKLQDLSYTLESSLSGILEANSITFDSVDFDTGHSVYQSQLKQTIDAGRTATA